MARIKSLPVTQTQFAGVPTPGFNVPRVLEAWISIKALVFLRGAGSSEHPSGWTVSHAASGHRRPFSFAEKVRFLVDQTIAARREMQS